MLKVFEAPPPASLLVPRADQYERSFRLVLGPDVTGRCRQHAACPATDRLAMPGAGPGRQPRSSSAVQREGAAVARWCRASPVVRSVGLAEAGRGEI